MTEAQLQSARESFRRLAIAIEWVVDWGFDEAPRCEYCRSKKAKGHQDGCEWNRLRKALAQESE